MGHLSQNIYLFYIDFSVTADLINEQNFRIEMGKVERNASEKAEGEIKVKEREQKINKSKNFFYFSKR